MREAIIAGGAALIGAVIAGLVAIIVNERSSKWKYLEWLLNHRQRSYVEMLVALQGCIDLRPDVEFDDRIKAHSRVFAASVQVALVAPRPVRVALSAAREANNKHLRDPSQRGLPEAAGDLEDAMLDDLQRFETPSGWWSRIRGGSR